MSTSGCQGRAGEDLHQSETTCEEVQGQVWQITSGNLELFHWLYIFVCVLQYISCLASKKNWTQVGNKSALRESQVYPMGFAYKATWRMLSLTLRWLVSFSYDLACLTTDRSAKLRLPRSLECIFASSRSSPFPLSWVTRVWSSRTRAHAVQIPKWAI